MITYGTIIIASWAAFLVVWGVSAFNVKKDIRDSGFRIWWTRYWLLRLAVAVLVALVVAHIATGTVHYTAQASVLSHGLFTPPVLLGWFAAALSVTGVAFAIWARVYLGRNWSPAPAVKEKHELVVDGPYAYVRHPIYTGVLLAALGTELTGTIFGVVVLFGGLVVFLLRIGKEEKIMLELFPNEYPAYQKSTKRLVPFVW